MTSQGHKGHKGQKAKFENINNGYCRTQDHELASLSANTVDGLWEFLLLFQEDLSLHYSSLDGGAEAAVLEAVLKDVLVVHLNAGAADGRRLPPAVARHQGLQVELYRKP